jgi:hypothetical protein
MSLLSGVHNWMKEPEAIHGGRKLLEITEVFAMTATNLDFADGDAWCLV